MRWSWRGRKSAKANGRSPEPPGEWGVIQTLVLTDTDTKTKTNSKTNTKTIIICQPASILILFALAFHFLGFSPHFCETS